MSLGELVFNDLINKHKVDKLVYLYNLNIITINQKNIIRNNILTNKLFIIDSVEKYGDLLETFKYKNEVKTIYELITNFTIEKADNFIYNITKFNNFNENDESFLWFLLYIIIYGNSITPIDDFSNENEKYIYDKFSKCDNINKMIGVLRVIEFNININEYFESWDVIEDFFIVEHAYDVNNTIFTYKMSYDYDGIFITLYKNYTFNIKYSYDFTNNDWIEINIDGEIFKYDDKYYFGKYITLYKILYPRNYNISHENLIKNPFILSASKNLNDILPFLRGEVNKIKEYYDGKIINGNYVRYNIFNNVTDFSDENLRNIINEVLQYK